MSVNSYAAWARNNDSFIHDWLGSHPQGRIFSGYGWGARPHDSALVATGYIIQLALVLYDAQSGDVLVRAGQELQTFNAATGASLDSSKRVSAAYSGVGAINVPATSEPSGGDAINLEQAGSSLFKKMSIPASAYFVFVAPEVLGLWQNSFEVKGPFVRWATPGAFPVSAWPPRVYVIAKPGQGFGSFEGASADPASGWIRFADTNPANFTFAPS